MKIVVHNGFGRRDEFGGKVRLHLCALDVHGRPMSATHGYPIRSFTIEFTTVEEVYELVYSIIKDVENSTMTNAASIAVKDGV